MVTTTAGSTTEVHADGTPERWLVAARLSRMTKRDLERDPDQVLNSIQGQDQKAAEWAQQHGHEIVHVTRDRNVSGAIAPAERPDLGPWLTDPDKLVQYDGIVAATVDRLSRDWFDVAWIRKWAETNRKKLYIIKERLAWPDARDGILWGVAAERAAEERKLIIDRVTDQMRRLEDNGKLHGRAPFGYGTAGEKYDRRLVPTAEGRRYVPLIYQHAIEGWSLKRIAAWLTAEGVKPVSGGWWPMAIALIIRNPTYRGHRCAQEPVPPDETETRNVGGEIKVIRWRYGDTWTETPRLVYGRVIHECEPLVDARTWRAASEALSARPGRGPRAAVPAMLAGVLFCPRCDDSPMYRIQAGPRRGRYVYYRCTGRGHDRRSCGNLVPAAAVEAAADAVMAAADIPVMVKKVIPGNEAALDEAHEKVLFAIGQLGHLGLADAEYDAQLAALRAERDAIARAERVPDRADLVPAGYTFAEQWAAHSGPDRAEWLRAQGFRFTADKQRLTVDHPAWPGPVSEPLA
jgi:site-specific DNA recombinase